MSTKRVQTDDIHASHAASNIPATLSPAVTPDLAFALRNVGMRARKSVLEGYAMNPNPQQATPSLRMKAMSTGTLFQSPRDVVRGDPQSSHICPRKRHRSASPMNNELDDESMGRLDGHPERPVKPLRRTAHAFQQSKSLLASNLFSDHSQSVPESGVREVGGEEDDWSFDQEFQASASSNTFGSLTMS